MQAVLPRWRNALILKKTITQSTSHLAPFHSTSPTSEKWRSKWKNSDVRKDQQQPTKNYIRYATRQKRADTKRALKDLLFKSGSSKFSFEEKHSEPGRIWDSEQADCVGKKERPKTSARRASKAKRTRQKLKRENNFDDSDEHAHVFHATFGNKWYTWSFKNWEEPSFRCSTTGFEWRKEPRWSKRTVNESDIESDAEPDQESCAVGKYSDRIILGLPTRGPLKLDDVKNAFRSAALRWHPDRNQGSSQEMAEEKFKQCVNAYKSLCDALLTA